MPHDYRPDFNPLTDRSPERTPPEGWSEWVQLYGQTETRQTVAGEPVDPLLEGSMRRAGIPLSPVTPDLPEGEDLLAVLPVVPQATRVEAAGLFDDDASAEGGEATDEDSEDDEDAEDDDATPDGEEASEEAPAPVEPEPSPWEATKGDSPFVRRVIQPPGVQPAAVPLRRTPAAAPTSPPGRQALEMPPVVPPAETLPGLVAPTTPSRPSGPVPGTAPRTESRGKLPPRIQHELTETLMRVGLTGAERDALLDSAADNDAVARALVRLSGMARVTHEASAARMEDIDALRQEGAAARETAVAANAIRFLHNLPGETALADRLLDAVSRMQVMEHGFQLKDGTGRPRIVGVVAAASLWYFREIPRSSKDARQSPWGQYTGTGAEFLNQILGWGRSPEKALTIEVDGQRMEVVENDWLCISLEVEFETTTQQVYLLTPAMVSEKKLVFDLPSSPDDTRYRILQGLLDGVAVRRPQGQMQVITDPLASAPLVLSRNFVPRRGKSDSCPTDTEELRESLQEQGITLACGSRAIWYLEPSWMAVRNGLFPIAPSSPEGVPGTPQFREWLHAARQRNIERFEKRVMPKRELLQLLLSSGEEGIDLPAVARILGESRE